MAKGRFRVVINGFTCHNPTFDDPLNFDGWWDEVTINVGVKNVGKDGEPAEDPSTPGTPVLGDLSRLPAGRIKAGQASRTGGFKAGNVFPEPDGVNPPYLRTLPLDKARNYPPFSVWEGEIEEDANIVFITPTIWEYDPGQSMVEAWVRWLQATDEQFGAKAKEYFGKIWPTSKPVFDAVSLSIQTIATLLNVDSPIAPRIYRPIGMTRDPANRKNFIFNPLVIPLSYENAKRICNQKQFGVNGLLVLQYNDDPALRGSYSLYIQVEELASQGGWEHIGHANGVRAFTALDGRLFCATDDNRLWMRPASRDDLAWTHIGHANDATAMTALNGRLYCTTRAGRLWARDPVLVDVPWTELGQADRVTGLAGVGNSLYCATTDNVLWSRPGTQQGGAWTRIGRANAVRSMATADGELLAATTDGKLWRRSVQPNVDWQVESEGVPMPMTGLAVTAGAMWATTRDNRLWWRDI